MSVKVIQEICYFESDTQITVGSRLPLAIGEIYLLPDTYVVIGQKFALVLREAGFTLNDFDHLSINFTTALAVGEMTLSDRITEKWLRYVDYGLDPAVVNGLSNAEKNALLLQVTTDIFLKLFADNAEKVEMIEKAAQRIRQKGEKLEIIYQTKNDKVVNVKIMLNLLDSGECSIFANIEDQVGNLLICQQIASCENLTQAMQYSGTILIRKNRVVIKPRNNVLTKELKPIEIGF